MNKEIWIGYDPREGIAFAVARSSICRRVTSRIPVHGLVLSDLQERGIYTRPMEWRDPPPEMAKRANGWASNQIMWDVLSDAPMSTEFACSRFLVPILQKTGWGLFMDCDMIVRRDIAGLFESLDPKFALYCVKHDFQPQAVNKMDNQLQTRYSRKLWSSFCIYNCEHPSNKKLTMEMVNSLPGRDLHRFCWLEDEEIGELGQEWNWIPGHSPEDIDPCNVHFTEGGPWFHGYEDLPFADEWRNELKVWAVDRGLW